MIPTDNTLKLNSSSFKTSVARLWTPRVSPRRKLKFHGGVYGEETSVTPFVEPAFSADINFTGTFSRACDTLVPATARPLRPLCSRGGTKTNEHTDKQVDITVA